MSDNVERCSICGEELTKFGNKELKDGVLCRNCVKLASSWLSDEDYKNRTVEEMKRHLAYREENLKKLEGFAKDRCVEGKYSLYIDDGKKEFVLSKRKDMKKENPDVISLDDVCEMSVTEEPYPEGEGVDIFFEAVLDNEELGKIRLRVNEFPGMTKDDEEYPKVCETALAYLDALADEEVFEEVEE